MKSTRFLIIILLWATLAGLLAGNATAASHGGEPKELSILEQWRGDYPVVHLKRLPEDQRLSRVGYLGDAATFAAVWRAFKPGEKVPEVDFSNNLVVFSRNVSFYNPTFIAKVTVTDDVAEVIVIETMSAMPIEDRVAMALAMIPRAGVRFIQGDNERIPVFPVTDSAVPIAGARGDGINPSQVLAADPMNATYMIEGEEIRLVHGLSEVEAAPGSATRIKTSVFGKPAQGDFDGDGDVDVALLLVYDPGGSGTFYYIAAAVNVNDTYRGTNAVLLGDRVAPQDVRIRNGVVIANYADRRPEESMTASPSIGKSKYLTFKDGRLVDIKPLDAGEQVVEGWVTIGHEVRSFVPCSHEADLWLLGESPALNEIMAAHRQALPDRKRYAPLFMVLVGRHAARPTEGFGAQYEGGFLATQLVRVSPRGNCKSESIVVDSPAPGAVVASPLRVRGRARGTWFFEGDFPLLVKDARGQVIAEKYATAKGDWMTEKFVPFEGTIEFKKPGSGDRGILIFRKDNPTGLPEHDDALEIPIFFR